MTKNLIICIPDTLDSFEFLEAALKYQLPLILLIKEKWLNKIQTFPWPYLIIEDFEDMEKVSISLHNFLLYEMKEREIINCIAFSEGNVELVGYLNTYFKTEGLNKNQAALFRDKYLMKLKAKELGVPTPLFARVQDKDNFYSELKKVCSDKSKPFSFLIKPRKSWACQGIERFYSIEEAERHFEKLENQEEYLLEEYLEAEMFHVGGLIDCGRTILSAIVKHDASLFEMGRSAPEHLILHTIDQNSLLSHQLKKAHDIITAGFHLKEGMTFIEFFKERESGELLLCEAAVRHPALHVPKLYEIVTGKNFFKEYANILSKKPTEERTPPSPKQESCYAGIISFASLPGRLIKVDSIDRFKASEIVYTSQPENLIGMDFKTISFKNTIGQIIIKTDTENRCQELLQTYCVDFQYQTEPLTK